MATRQGQGTLVYSPAVEAYVATANGVLDLSSDIIAGQVHRVSDGLSTFNLTLNNKNHKYTGKIARQDRIVVFLKKFKRTQVFAGYLSRVPAFDMYPTTVRISGHCTLKRLMYTYWNPMLPASAALIAQSALPTVEQLTNDSGVAQNLFKLLTTVGKWDPSTIHIQNIPKTWINFAKTNAKISDKDAVLDKLRQALGFGSDTNPTSPSGAGSGNAGTSADEAALGIKPQGAMGTITALECALVAREVGFAGHDLVIAVAVAHAESTFQTRIFSKPNTDGTIDRGLWQINTVHAEFSDADMKDAVKNGRAAMKIYKGRGGTWQPWSTYNNGAYLSYMDKAQQAVDSLPAPGTKTSTPPSSGTGGTTQIPTTGGVIGSTPAPPTGGSAPGLPITSANPKNSADIVIATAKEQLGKPYVWATHGPNTFDCSGLASYCYGKAGIKITPQTNSIYKELKHKSMNDLAPGDLILYGDPKVDLHHVVIYIGLGQVIEAAESGVPIRTNTVDKIKSYNGQGYPVQFPGSASTGVVGVDDNPDDPSSPLGVQVFNALFLSPQIKILGTDSAYGGELSLINAEQLLNTVTALTKAGLRSFMSGPNGDFIAYYPDYFGINGNAAKFVLEDIEAIDLSIEANDDSLATHVFTAGDNLQTFGPVTEAEWLNTSGVVTVEQKLIFEQLLGIHNDPNLTPEKIYQRFGARPLKAEFPQIRSGIFEYFQALHLFMRSWASQYSTKIALTFMPELWPGMRVELAGRGLAVYIEEVTHNFSYADGFTTDVVISSPSNTKGGFGLPFNISGI